MKCWHLLLVSIGCALNIQAADSNRSFLGQFIVPDRGLLLVRWSEVESNSVRVSIRHHTRNGVLQATNCIVSFRYADLPDPVVRRIYGFHRRERIEIKGRDGLTSVAGSLRFIKEATAVKSEKCTLQLEFETKEEAEMAADYLAGRTRRPRNT